MRRLRITRSTVFNDVKFNVYTWRYIIRCTATTQWIGRDIQTIIMHIFYDKCNTNFFMAKVM